MVERLQRRIAVLELERPWFVGDVAVRLGGEEWLRLVTDNIPVLICYVDAERRYRFSNRPHEAWHGIPRDQIIGRHVREVLGDDTYAAIRHYVDQALRGEAVEHDHFLRNADGEERYLHARYVPHLEDDGRVLGIFVLLNDITERKRAVDALHKSHEELESRVDSRTKELHLANAELRKEIVERKRAEDLLRASEARLRRAQKMARLAYWEWHSDDNKLRLSPYVAAILGVPVENLPTTDAAFNMWIHDDDRDRVVRVMAAAKSERRNTSIEYRVVRGDGEIRYIHEIGELVLDRSGVLVSMVGTMQDITERRQLEHQLLQASKLATLGELATGTAHELSQPLHIIRMAADSALLLMEEGAVSVDEQEDHFRIISDQTRRMAEILDHILMFGRVDEEEPLAFDPADCIRRAIAMVADQFRTDGVVIEPTIPNECRPVLGRPVRLEQVMMNLLGNARDSIVSARREQAGGGEFGGTVGVSVVDDRSRGAIVITVTDDGGGIGKNDLDRIFEPFYTSKSMGKGTGLGLSISYGIVTGMGGAIEVRNVAGGARFEIALPVASNRD